MNLRPATNADRAEIEALVFAALHEHGLSPSPDSTDIDLADIEGFYGNGSGFFDVLIDSDEIIVGTVAIHRTEDELCELRKMYLAPAARGGGWGRRLLDHAIERAREMGFRRIWLETADSLESAHRLYERNGFEPYRAPHQSERCDFAMIREI